MVKVGCHVSIGGSIDRSVDRAKEVGCETFQIFSRNPRGWKFRILADKEVEDFIAKIERFGIYPPVDHMPYLPNLASPKDNVYRLSVDTLKAELERCGQLRIPFLVTHLGSHLGAGREEGFKRITNAVKAGFSKVDNDVTLLLETTAGTKGSMGGTFEDIRHIMDGIDSKDRVGVCFDTCHVLAAGYELRSKEGLEETLRHFDRVVGLGRLKVVHINDSKGDLGSHLDRHEHVGMGKIGESGFKVILHNGVFRKLPLILETPVDSRRTAAENIRKVRELAACGNRING